MRWLGALYFCWALLATIKPEADTAKMWRSFLRAQFGWLGGLPAVILWLGAILFIHRPSPTRVGMDEPDKCTQ